MQSCLNCYRSTSAHKEPVSVQSIASCAKREKLQNTTVPQAPKFLINFRLMHPSTDWKVLESMIWDQKAHPVLDHEWNPQ